MIHTGIIYGGEEGIYAGYMLQYQEDEIRRKYKYPSHPFSEQGICTIVNQRKSTSHSM
jgi:hypothetical protein